MPSRLTAKDAARIAETAFNPLRCSAFPDDRGNQLRISILNGVGDVAIGIWVLTSAQFFKPARFKDNILQIRACLEQDGVQLSPWNFPVISLG